MYPKVSKFSKIDEQKVICLGENKNNLRFMIIKNVNKFAFGQHGLRQGILWCVKQDAKICFSTTFSVGHTIETATTDHYHCRQFHLTIPSSSKRQVSRSLFEIFQMLLQEGLACDAQDCTYTLPRTSKIYRRVI